MDILERRWQRPTWLGAVVLAATGFVILLCGGLFSIWKEMAGPNLAPLTFMMTIGPDGDAVYYDTLVNGEPCIATDSVQNWAAQRAIIITNGGNPLLSGDGRLLFFDRKINGRTEVWCYDTQNQQERNVISSTTDCFVCEVNLDGTQIIVTTSSWGGGLGRRVQHQLVDVETGDISRLPDYGAAFVRDKGVVYSRQSHEGLWLKRPDGTSQQILPQGHFPKASPDGQRLLYVKDVSSSLKKWAWEVYDLAEDRMIPVGQAMSPSFSSDGNTIVFLDPALNGVAWSIDLETGHRTNLGQLPGYISGWRTSSGGVGAVASGTVILFDSKTNTVRQLPIGPWTRGVKYRFGVQPPGRNQRNEGPK